MNLRYPRYPMSTSPAICKSTSRYPISSECFHTHIILFPQIVPRYLFSAKNVYVYCLPLRPFASRPHDIRRGREQSESPPPSPSASLLHSFSKMSLFNCQLLVAVDLIDWIMGRNLVSGPGCDFWGVSSVT